MISPEVRIGQVWQETRPNYSGTIRTVRIEAIEGGFARVLIERSSRMGEAGRRISQGLQRFSADARRYRLISDTPS